MSITLDFVICSYNFPPMNDAEAHCTARFASSLARAGHRVTVITMGHSPQNGEGVPLELLDPAVEITRVPFRKIGPLKMLLMKMRYMSFLDGVVDLPDLIAATRRKLIECPSSVFISRSGPELSGIAAWYNRRHANMWIAHFSDPLPWFFGKSVRGRIKSASQSFWGRRILRNAQVLSITCKRAARFFAEFYGTASLPETLVVPHIGAPELRSIGFVFERLQHEFVIAHCGALMYERHADYVISELARFARIHGNVRLALFGPVCKRVRSLLCQSDLPFRVTFGHLRDPGHSSCVYESADVNLVVDLGTGLPYSPFLPSKFSYAVFFDRPVVCCSIPDSEMADISNGGANGVFFANVLEPGALVKCLVESSQYVAGSGLKSVCALYGEAVVTSFVDSVLVALARGRNR